MEEEKKNFDYRVPFNQNIYEYIINQHVLFGYEYKLIGIICTPVYDHYNGIIVDLAKNIKNLQSGLNYFNDGRIQNSKIIAVENLEEYILNNNPYIALYSRLNK